MPVRAGISGVDNAAATVAGVAIAGVAVGMIFGLAALAAGPVAAGVAGSALWLWVAAVATAALAAVRGGPPGARLGVIEAPGAPAWWSGPYAMIALYAILAFTVAMVAARLGAPRRQVALSGLVGPALLASAYAIAGSGAPVDPAAATAAAGSAAPFGTVASAGSGGDIRVAVLVAAVAGLLASTAVAMRRARAAVPAVAGAAVWPAEGSGAVVTTRPTAVMEPAAPAAPTRRGRAATLDEAPKPTRKARPARTAGTAATARAARTAATVAAPAPAVPAQRKARKSAAPSRKSAARKAAAPAEVPAVAPAAQPVERRLATEAERMSRREREHVKWMENLLNTPADPTLTTRRSSS
jgi:hypothetical protein